MRSECSLMTKCKENLRKTLSFLVGNWRPYTLQANFTLFQGSLCSRAVGNGVFLAASDSPSPLLAVAEMGQAISMWRVQWQTPRLTHATWFRALKATSHHRLGTSTIPLDTDPANSQ